MANVFPNSNLSTSSQPWGREVQKRVETLESQLSLQRTNSATVDAQLQSSYRRLDATVGEVQQAAADATVAAADAAAAAAQANTAINGLVGLGSTGSSYNINAGNINVGTLSGVAVFTSSGNRGATLYDAKLSFDWNSSQTGYIQSFIESGTTIFEMQTNIGSSVVLSNGNVYLGANYGAQGLSINSAGITVAGNLNAPGYTLSGSGLSVTGTASSGSVSTGSISTSSSITSGGNIRAPGITSTTFLQAENHAGGGTTGASINTNGTIIRTSSSERYKQDIENLSVDYDDLLSLEPKRFRLKDEAAEDADARYYAGFIAEEIDQTSLKDFVAYRTMEDGSVVPDGVYYGELTAALLEAIKHQDSIIKSLTNRLEILENDKV